MIDAITENEAKTRYIQGPWFSVAVGDDLAVDDNSSSEEGQGVPTFVLEIEPGATAVNTFFYDAFDSIWLIYHFKRMEDRLFLAEVTRYEYPDSSRWYGQNEAKLIEMITYTPEGVTLQAENDTVAKRRRVTERDQVDVAPHWEPIPEFGDWAGLGRLDRASESR